MSGRPLFTFNELVDYRITMENLGNRLPSWTAEDTRKPPVYHEPMARQPVPLQAFGTPIHGLRQNRC